jgi:hypothetical protein
LTKENAELKSQVAKLQEDQITIAALENESRSDKAKIYTLQEDNKALEKLERVKKAGQALKELADVLDS